jgi:hypothetical protein
MLAGLWCVFWALLGRRMYRDADPDSTPSEDLKRRIILRVWRFVLGLGIVLVVVGVVRLIVQGSN